MESIAKEMCYDRFGFFPDSIAALKASGSGRRYYRLTHSSFSCILCHSDNVKENDTFIRLSRYLKEKGIPVPEIFSVSESHKHYLLQDLGNCDLFGELRGRKNDDALWNMIRHTLADLVRFQRLPEAEWKNMVEFDPLDHTLIAYDLNYAKTNLFDISDIEYNADGLQADFVNLEGKLLSYPENLRGLMFRDFQSRNIMISGGRPYFIDYQSARKGPGIYDLVSFAWQAKAGFTEEERNKIRHIYIKELEKAGVSAEKEIEVAWPYWALFRILQTLGAYGLRGLKEGKTHFIQSLPFALENCRRLLEFSLKGEFPELENITNSLKFCNFAKN